MKGQRLAMNCVSIRDACDDESLRSWPAGWTFGAQLVEAVEVATVLNGVFSKMG